MHWFLKFILEMKHVEFHSKNKLVHLVGFIIRAYICTTYRLVGAWGGLVVKALRY
jgi:hypothetical protein